MNKDCFLLLFNSIAFLSPAILFLLTNREVFSDDFQENIYEMDS